LTLSDLPNALLAVAHAATLRPFCRRLEHFQEKHALAEARVESGFPSENATMRNERSAARQAY
jgi:hypothetical protein